ncbi:MAG: hypothetical protein AVDCRST_MAG49-4145 [uncultured Thermomicrobiales bacterium]|uniref:Uncharacterized protein n=1 Tax=uncultured Thermomicrobiales bacterium TaxID=1645740 RepID=A0A6J4VDD4_9BACT|nr:MAG: hypothetical protein AVDCRST_MAG49-4145 [uncultured Thermomicrobiales bacterium]
MGTPCHESRGLRDGRRLLRFGSPVMAVSTLAILRQIAGEPVRRPVAPTGRAGWRGQRACGSGA